MDNGSLFFVLRKVVQFLSLFRKNKIRLTKCAGVYNNKAHIYTPIWSVKRKEREYIMAIIKITSDNFDKEVLHSDLPVLIDFWASWCGPCQMLSPIIEEVAGEVTDVKVGKLNVDEEPELASRFGVMSIPTLVVMSQGRVVNQSVGYIGKNEVLALIGK